MASVPFLEYNAKAFDLLSGARIMAVNYVFVKSDYIFSYRLQLFNQLGIVF